MARKARRRKPRTRPYRRTPPGASPGTLVADPHAFPPVLDVMAFGPDGVEEKRIERPADLRSHLGRHPVTWINMVGLADINAVREMGTIFHLHPLAQEDVINAWQRAKVEPYDDRLFIVVRMLSWQEGKLASEQLSIFLGPDFVLTFQEVPGDCLDPVRERIRAGAGTIRSRGPDYLAYALIDAVIDGYFPVLEECGERLEVLEDEILRSPDRSLIRRVHETKRDLLLLRRAAWPLREAINALLRDSAPLIREETRPFLRDCYDHTVQIIDLIETYRELGSDLTDVYLSSLSQRTNDIMRWLTVTATIFIPLTFFAGIWGMNFRPEASPWNMPELRWRYGYPAALLFMAAVAGAMLLYFRRKGWLGAPHVSEEDLPEPDRREGKPVRPQGGSTKPGR
jgi:magnesium transporter